MVGCISSQTMHYSELELIYGQWAQRLVIVGQNVIGQLRSFPQQTGELDVNLMRVSKSRPQNQISGSIRRSGD